MCSLHSCEKHHLPGDGEKSVLLLDKQTSKAKTGTKYF
jgi:hypothetical protein